MKNKNVIVGFEPEAKSIHTQCMLSEIYHKKNYNKKKESKNEAMMELT